MPIILIALFSAFITLLCGGMMRRGFYYYRGHIISDATLLFEMAIDEERNSKLETVPIFSHRSPQSSPNRIPIEEKENWNDQCYLMMWDSNRYLLDSLFRAKLAERDIPAQSAVRCRRKEGVTSSSPDSLFYQKAVALEPVVYRISDNPEERLELQGYIQIPFWFIVGRITSLSFILAMWVLFNGMLWGGFLFWKKFRKNLPEDNNQEEVGEFEKITERKLLTKKSILPARLQFDRDTGYMVYKAVNIRLSGNGLKLFCLFLDRRHTVLTYQDICRIILKRKVEDKLSESDRDAVFAAVRRLRNDLSPISLFKLEVLRNNGYRLMIKEEPDSFDLL